MATKETIVITCASGKQAAPLIRLLHTSQKYNLRLIVHSTSSLERLQKSYPDVDVRTTELTEPSQCLAIVKDAAVVYHIGPSLHPHETTIGINMIDAAKASRSVKHFVYSSVLNSQFRKLMNHDCKRYVEEHLIESELPYTILCPTHFMDTLPIPMFLKQMETKQKGEGLVFPAMWNPEVKFSFVALQDLAEAAFTVIEQREKHFRAKYDIVSTELLSYNEVLKKVGGVLGREIRAEQKGFEDAVATFGARLFGGKIKDVDSGMRDGLERLLLYYNRHGLQGSSNVLEWLIGRKLTGHEEWTKQMVESLTAT
ncbi:uncharacterized protein PAC_06350 [Phialocephala subalpina]|uniref:NmrA-like domain-containing protein n=1 Tax=Phialocephala subalpina TaxID=576137 RepID=A0A1L7WUK4_9HELO|nr:uncharacterized protein PAC_06350 [Phialocephala subalpina]